MPVLHCYVDERTHSALLAYSQSDGRSIEQLAEAAISDAASRAEVLEPSRQRGLALTTESRRG